VGNSNKLAYTACSSLCNMNFPADHVFLCSGPGLGKTHLLQSIGQFFCKNQKNGPLKIMYVSSEQFGNQLVRAIKSKKVEEFKSYYRDNIDLLLLEDIHFFQGKEKMQEELLSLIKALETQGNKFVFSSSFLPKELNKIDQQLTSYFCSGVLAPIEKPDFDFRFRLIKKKAKRYNLELPPKVTELIAKSITSDIRQLESCLQNILLKSQMLQEKVSHDLAREVLQNYSQDPQNMDMDHIVESICKAFEISFEKLRSKTRKKQVVMARNTAFFLARKHTELSLKNIGQYLNRRHSTVLKGISNIEKEMRQETQTGRQLTRIVETIESIT
jgi:chromosomal replication initiator protein